MKVCHLCGESYKDCVDFCFNDGEVLQTADAAGDVAEEGLDAPMAPRRVQGAQQSFGATPVTQPVTRARHTLTESDTRTAAEPVPAPNVLEDEEESDELVPPALGDDVEDDDDQITVPPSSVDTAPMERPSSTQKTPILPPRAGEVDPSLSTAPTPERPSRSPAPQQRTASPSPVPAASAQSHTTPSPPPRAMTFDGEEEQGGSSLVLLGVAAFVLSLFFVLGAGAVFVGMSSGVFGPDDGATADVRTPDPVVVPDPPPAPPPVPEQPVPEVEPVVPEPPEPAVAAQPQPQPQPPPQPPVRPQPAPPQPPVAVVVPQPAPAVPQPPPVATFDVGFETAPPGAEVKVAGKSWGVSPITKPLKPGTYEWELSLNGHEPVSGTFTVNAAPVKVNRELKALAPPPAPEPEGPPKVGVIMVFARGFVGADLLMDGKAVGKLPARILEVPAGEHEFVIRPASGDELKMRHDVVITDPSSPAVINLVP